MGNKVPPRGVPKKPRRISALAVTAETVEVGLAEGEKRTARLLHRLLPLTEEQFVEEALELATWDGGDYRAVCDVMVRLEYGARNVRAARSVWVPLSQEGVEGDVMRKVPLALRDGWRRRLAAMVDDIGGCRERAGEDVGLLAWGGIVQVPRPLLMKGRLLMSAHYLPDTVVAALDFVELLLLAEDRTYGDRLRRCQLPGCGRFFLQRQGGWGRARSKFCKKEHGKEAHGAASRDRMRAMRERRKNNAKARRRK